MECCLCGWTPLRQFFSRCGRDYLLCENCELIQMSPSHRMDNVSVLERYKKHNNDTNDRGYMDFLGQVAAESFKIIGRESECLDYGCGPSRAMEKIFVQNGYRMESFDPLFFPGIKDKNYDLITCNEVVEHFVHVKDELKKMRLLLADGGAIVIGTCVWDRSTDFQKWHYLTDPTHVSMYSNKTLGFMACRLGFELSGTANPRVFVMRPPK